MTLMVKSVKSPHVQNFLYFFLTPEHNCCIVSTMDNAHLFILPLPIADSSVHCQMCHLPPARGIFRVEVPHDEETARFMDVRICKHCASGLVCMLNDFIDSP